MRNKIKLGDIFIIYAVVNDYGIFNELSKYDTSSPPQPVYPLVENFITQDNYDSLDTDYEIGFSAEKPISPLLEKLWVECLIKEGFSIEDFLSGNMNQSDILTCIRDLYDDFGLTDIIYNRFGVKWKKIYDSLVASVYNPIDNYNMEETRTPNLTTGNTTDAESKSGIYGFNGSSAKDSAKNGGTSNSTISITGTETTTRKGNIGVTTTQQMIEQELELRKHDFYRIIYSDIDSILCLKIY